MSRQQLDAEPMGPGCFWIIIALIALLAVEKVCDTAHNAFVRHQDTEEVE